MENEGIMGLPAGQAMQNQGSENQPLYISSADSYDAALSALGMSADDPAQVEAVRQAVRESIDELDLSPTEMDALLEVLEYMSQNPDQYPQIRQRLIDSGMMDADDLPEAYDPAFLGMAIMALNEAMSSQAQGAAAPMEMAPQMQGMQGTPAAMGFAEGGLADVAKYLAAQGRNGDSILAHITPAEARLLKSMGGSGTINPETGLPEFFLKKLFKKVKSAVKKILKNPIVRVIATVALATVLGPAAAAVAGKAGVIMSSAATAAVGSAAAGAAVSAMSGEKISLRNVLVNAATGYFGAGGTIGRVNPTAAIAGKVGQLTGAGAQSAIAQGVGAGVTGTGIGLLSGLKPREALQMGAQAGLMAGATQAAQNYRAATRPTSPSMQGDTSAFSPEGGAGAGQPQGGAQPAGAAGASATDGPTSLIIRNTGQEVFPGGQGPASPAMGGDMSAFVPGGAGGTGGIAPPTGATSAVEYYSPAYGVKPSTGLSSISPMPTTAAPAGAAAADTFFGRVGQFFEKPSTSTFTDAFLVNPKATTTLGKYAPGVATALTVTGALGGFKQGEVNENPLFNRDYTGESYIRDNPELFKNRVEATKLEPYNPVVPTPSYGQQPQSSTQPGPSTTGQPPQYTAPTIPVTPAPTYVPPPFSVTNQPQGIPQPYNVSGLYGVPLLYGNNQPQPARPPGYAQGGAAVKPGFKNPQHVAQTEAMLYAGPQAAQQTAVAMDYLANKGIMGAQKLRKGGQPTKFPRKTGPINGPGTGTSDSIPAMLSDGEFVFTAKAVRNAGNGSRRKGARRMYKLMKMLEGGKV
jgi:hypothetical protein